MWRIKTILILNINTVHSGIKTFIGSYNTNTKYQVGKYIINIIMNKPYNIFI